MRYRDMRSTSPYETNGTIYQPVSESCLMSVSPKLASSAPKYENERRQNKWFARHNAARIDMDVLKLFVDDARYYQLKFVISDRNEMDEVLPLLDDLNANRNKVYLMPEGRTREDVQINAEMVWDLAIKYGLRYSPRLQVDLFDDKRGV